MRLALAAAFAASLVGPAAAAGVDRDISASFGPVRDQKDIGWCYANATADMLGWKYHTPEPVSAAHVALLRNRAISSRVNAEGGSLSGSIFNYATLNPRGLCKASALEDYVFPRLRAAYPRLRLNGYGDLFSLVGALRDELASPDRAAALAAGRSVLAALDLHVVPSPEFVDALASPSVPAQARMDAITGWLADRLCERGGYMPAQPALNYLFDLDPDVSVHPNAALQAAQSAINRHFSLPSLPDPSLRDFPGTVRRELARGRPVGLSYSSGFLNDASKGFSYADLHASVIVGAKCEPGQECLFKVRNSWGARCSYGNPAIQASCLPDPGHYWITASQLRTYGSSIVRFRR
jgi:hypothetical protein